HADAVDRRPQRRLQPGRLRPALPAAADGSRLRVPGGQRRGAAASAQLVAALDPPADRAAEGPSGVRPRDVRGTASRQSANLRPRAHLRGRHRVVRAQPRPVGPGGPARSLALGGVRSRGDARSYALPRDRRAAVLVDARAARLLLVPTAEGRRMIEDQRALIDYVTAQRWFGSKTRDVSQASIV